MHRVHFCSSSILSDPALEREARRRSLPLGSNPRRACRTNSLIDEVDRAEFKSISVFLRKCPVPDAKTTVRHRVGS